MATLNDILNTLNAKTSGMEAFGKIIKLSLDGETVVIDGTTTPPSISQDEREAEVTATATIDTFDKIINSKMNVQMAIMSGKIKVQGDMIAALPLMKML